jgi:apolipoprotein N-acyltransferase
VYRDVAKRNRTIFTLVGVLFLPIVVSQIFLSLLSFHLPNGKIIQTVILQPNVDPYKEKFALSANNEAFADSLINLANRHVTNQTDLVIAPETALPLSFLEDRLHTFEFGKKLQEQVHVWPRANLLIGASTLKLFDSKQSVASTPIPNEKQWYESYNSALLLSKKKEAQYTHKSKLVPGVELIPFSAYLPFLSAIAIENGGTSGTLGVEKEPKVLEVSMQIYNEKVHASQKTVVALAPIICY